MILPAADRSPESPAKPPDKLLPIRFNPRLEVLPALLAPARRINQGLFVAVVGVTCKVTSAAAFLMDGQMVLDSLHPEVRDALVSCCSIKAFNQRRFNRLIAEYRLEDRRAVLLDEVYGAVVVAAYERRRQRRRLRRWRQASAEPSLN